ncbi:MAG: flippase-like domain-containing protein [Pyrinomonadaceae bacterium]|nr:flippase-like domain-containing protein [Pyrinomonadaceae bacterium]
MRPESITESPEPESETSSGKNLNRFKIFVAVFTMFGVVLFVYLIYSVGLENVLDGIARIGISGFIVLQLIYFLRITVRATAWRLSVYAPYKLGTKDTLPAVIIGEAMSSMIPLGILVSGTSKAIAVRHRVPLVVGLSSIATENLFYSVITGIFICLGSFTFLRSFDLSESWIFTIDLLIVATLALIAFIVFIVIKQWHFASQFCEWLYNRNIATRFLESGRLQVRLFENLIYGFYRQYPKRFLPIFLCQVSYHLLGIAEAWFILSRVRDMIPSIHTAFLLESISRAITIFFKFVPFVIGVDEAGAQFVTETLAIGAGVGVTIAIIRKGRIIFWTTIGLILIAKRGLSIKEFARLR